MNETLDAMFDELARRKQLILMLQQKVQEQAQEIEKLKAGEGRDLDKV